MIFNVKKFLHNEAREQKAINKANTEEFLERKTSLLLLQLRDGRKVRRSELIKALGICKYQFAPILAYALLTNQIDTVMGTVRGDAEYQLAQPRADVSAWVVR
jgi:hypothetical protein